MRDSKLFGKCSMTRLNCKIKLVVFYGSKKDKGILNELRNECDTSTCQYALIPIHIKVVGNSINEAIIKKYIRARVSGYKKDLDKVCIIEPDIIQLDQYIIFDSVNNFKIWFQRVQNTIGLA